MIFMSVGHAGAAALLRFLVIATWFSFASTFTLVMAVPCIAKSETICSVALAGLF